LDSLNLFWDDLKGPRSVVYLPNAGHGLEVHRDYAMHGIGAFFRHVVSKRPMPELSWKPTNDNGDGLGVAVTSSKSPKSVAFWVAQSDTSDFRESRWESFKPLGIETGTNGSTRATHSVAKPAKGSIALFGDLAYDIDGLEYHLSTQIFVKPEKP
jgi:PhoPQ-activated pathogenicity-related protein